MFLKSSLTILTLACGYGTYYMYNNIYTPQAPAPIRYDLSFADIPKTAWCTQKHTGEPALTMECAWITEAEPRYASTVVEVPLPEIQDLSAWNFERETLQAVPEMKYWFTVNSGYVLGIILFGFCTLISGVFSLPEKKSPRKAYA